MTPKEFALLPSKVRDQVLDAHRDCHVQFDDWTEFVIEDFKDQMIAYGMEAESVYWSGFCSQGDGACFAGGIKDLKLFIASNKSLKEFEPLLQTQADDLTDISMWWKQSGYYSHAQSLVYNFSPGLADVNEADFNSPVRLAVAKQIFNDTVELLGCFEEAVRFAVQEHCFDFYKNLEEEYDYLTSDECVLDHLVNNDSLDDAVATAKDQLGIEDELEPTPSD